jgi:hypothetical protein
MLAASKIFEFVKHEFLQVLPPTIYFLCTFHIVALTTSMVLEQFEIHVSTHAVATVLALLVGKVVLVVNKMPLLRKLDGQPLVYPIVFKAVIYSVFVLLLRLLEHWIPGLLETGSIARATSHLMEGVAWRLFWMGQIWIFVLFVFYTTAVEFIALFGLTTGQLSKAFFRQHPSSLAMRG